jgi:hypothetical protein
MMLRTDRKEDFIPRSSYQRQHHGSDAETILFPKKLAWPHDTGTILEVSLPPPTRRRHFRKGVGDDSHRHLPLPNWVIMCDRFGKVCHVYSTIAKRVERVGNPVR